jgi:hypothetical protein
LREAGLELEVAHLLLATQAGGTTPAGADERHRDAVPELPPFDAGPDLRDDAGVLVARHVGQHHLRVMTHPGVPVASAEPGRRNLDDDTGLGAGGFLDSRYLRQLPEAGVANGTHGQQPQLDSTTVRRTMSHGGSAAPRRGVE